MNTTAPAVKPQRAVPAHLVYEVMDGKPIYYRDYKKIIRGAIKKDDIMGYGLLQALILNVLAGYFRNKIGKNYWVLDGEMGLHIAQNQNLSLAFVVLSKKQLVDIKLENKYLHLPPQLVIEVDTKAQAEFAADANYYTKKTQKLLDFGVNEVIWVFTETKKIWLAKPNAPWLIINWKDDFTAMELPLNLQALLDENGIEC